MAKCSLIVDIIIGELTVLESSAVVHHVKNPLCPIVAVQCKGDDLRKAVSAALECGYRHIDTAALYENEDVIGDVLRQWITTGRVSREELFITTKLPPIGNRPSDVEKYLSQSLKKLKVDYVDLYLIHAPISAIPEGEDDVRGKILDFSTDLEAVYKVMEQQVDAGRARGIGLSNFNSKQIERIMKVCRIKPVNLQVEVHAYFQQKPLRSLCRQFDISVCAYCPLGAPHLHRDDSEKYPRLIEHPVVTSMALRLNKTPAQILLRHLIQLGLIVIPKSVSPERIQENFQVWDFKLPPSDMADLDALDRGGDGRVINFQLRPGVQNHPEYPFSIPF
ncbi:1,5-anhydro-D-fructose reductase-like isoform X2 [Macrobrachium rosenbergii]|uniref:1,5-anhydro-D-fructose reductase-like isoform X2 n=1 Tax=Macrobrachium rosenbergii TaxID=79674 RepID=UPI0034D39265